MEESLEMKVFMRLVSSLSENIGRLNSWLCVMIILILCTEVVARYVFQSPTKWASDLSKMLGMTLATVGWSYTLLHKGHVRVDILYSHLSQKGKAILDSICMVFLFLPLLASLAYRSWSWMIYAWTHNEKWYMTTWMPPVAPLRTIFFAAICLFTLQVIVEFSQNIYTLVGRKYD
jgi:TRAP-type mannitol/chloroaromatic compound transport system permease small subunit